MPLRGTWGGTTPGCANGGAALHGTGWPGCRIARGAAVHGAFPPLQHAQIVALACTPPAEVGRAWVRWTVRALHDEIERRQIATLHPSTVHHILADADLHPHQVRSWRPALAEDFESKAASVLWDDERAGALADHGALVVCLDEKPNIQALGRPIPDLPPAPGYALRRDWEDVRHGTANLLVIYNLLTGRLWGRVLARTDAAHFLPALEAYLAELPWEIRCVHCILDNGASHIAKVTRAWIAAQEGLVRFHFTPTHASWLNQAELALGAFSRRYLRDRVSESRQALITTSLPLATRVQSVARTIHFSGHSQGTPCTNGTLAELGPRCTRLSRPVPWPGRSGRRVPSWPPA
ncbi:MAG: IS630 family transposase [Armatimonadota bacterium]|nr:IS630 family transposase [Armatimonadota bacterium]